MILMLKITMGEQVHSLYPYIQTYIFIKRDKGNCESNAEDLYGRTGTLDIYPSIQTYIFIKRDKLYSNGPLYLIDN